MIKNSIVVCRLPKTGLGNQLFPLMKAYVFSHLNKFPILITGYHKIMIGPYLRGEKSKRSYNNYFTFQKSVLGEFFDNWKLARLKQQSLIDEPFLEKVPAGTPQRIYKFGNMSHWSDYFSELKDNRDLVIKLFWDILTEGVKAEATGLEPPVIGVHIRMGDFKKLETHQDFAKLGAVRTPEKYFVDIILSIRKVHGSDLPVSVFTDGFAHEFDGLFKLSNIRLVEGNRDIVDLILLSKSKIIVTSASSTFSYWAGFLSDAPLIMHPDHIHKPLRSEVIAETIYEGPFNGQDELLKKNIQSITL